MPALEVSMGTGAAMIVLMDLEDLSGDPFFPLRERAALVILSAEGAKDLLSLL